MKLGGTLRAPGAPERNDLGRGIVLGGLAECGSLPAETLLLDACEFRGRPSEKVATHDSPDKNLVRLIEGNWSGPLT
jgi:hypothetical protein